jgi:uncharacterized protein (TIGR02147 family)
MLNQATTTADRQFYAEQLFKSRSYKKIQPLKESQFHYYAYWYLVPVRELINVEGFKEDPQWIANKIKPAITTAEARRALEDLQKLDLVRRDANGKLVQSSPNLNTADEVTSSVVAQYHKEMLKKAVESIDRFPREKREISCATFSVTPHGARRIKELVQKFRQDILDITAQEVNPQNVYQLNFQLFPLSDDDEGKTS